MIELPNSLPIQDVIKDIQLQLHTHDELILEAPPGAGKTTLVPLALIDQTWLGDKKILMLEPRRIAARSAAHRLAELLGEQPGQTVGYRMRLDSRVSNATKLEVITEGILTRMLQVDPSLEDVGLVIFDEFHERSLDSDLALALCLKGRELFRRDEPLKLLVMSATLESNKTADLLNAPIIVSEGKQFPVDIIQGKASQPRDQIVSRVVEVTMQALVDNPHSSLLVFLPGQGEIQRAFDELSVLFRQNQFNSILLKPLFGNLSIEEQTRAISPSEPGKTKVVLATNIAETSLTIDGVDVVIDSGLVRQPVFDPNTGMTRLSTVKISKASSIQRAGRAGRLRPGKCYRLWSRDQQERLAPYSSPEILSADLAPLVLQLRQWGVDDPAELSWLDPPPPGPWQQALELLTSLGAIKPEVSLTDHGASMATLPVHPRLAHLLIRGKQVNQVETACLLAALLSERDPFSRDDPDIDFRLEVLNGQTQCRRQFMGWKQRVNQLASQFKTQLAKLNFSPMFELEPGQVTGYLLACAYPDRLARRRHSGGYQLSNGRSARFQGNYSLGKSNWIAVAEVGGLVGGKGDSIRSAATISQTLFENELLELVQEKVVVEWDTRSKRFVAESRKTIGALVLSRARLNSVPALAKQSALLQYLSESGIGLLPWNAETRQWQARVMLARTVELEFPDVSDEHLLATSSTWLSPYIDIITKLDDFKRLDLDKILGSLLTWQQTQRLNDLTPERMNVPSGSRIKIDYTKDPPVLAPKLQEMFGCNTTPTVLDGRLHLMVHLLSPAGRPLQITQDLAGFWQGSYREVMREMKGRYPRHPWPDDPTTATPTRKTKRRQ